MQGEDRTGVPWGTVIASEGSGSGSEERRAWRRGGRTLGGENRARSKPKGQWTVRWRGVESGRLGWTLRAPPVPATLRGPAFVVKGKGHQGHTSSISTLSPSVHFSALWLWPGQTQCRVSSLVPSAPGDLDPLSTAFYQKERQYVSLPRTLHASSFTVALTGCQQLRPPHSVSHRVE